MLRLNLSRAPSWMDLAQGVRVEVEPIGSTIMAAASSEAYAPSAAEPDAPDAAAKPALALNAGAQSVAFVKAVARRSIRAWEGVMDEAGKPLAVSDETVDALMEQSVDCLRAFREGYVNKANDLVAEGNGSAPSPSGTTEGAPDTAKAAPDDAPTARKSKTDPKA